MTSHSSDDEARRREADDILRRVRQETDPQTGASVERIVLGARSHFWGGDADPNDRMEVWGTRIGRLAGLVVFVILAVMLLRQLGGP